MTGSFFYFLMGMLVHLLTGVDIDPPVTARLSDVETAVTIAPVNVCKIKFIQRGCIGGIGE